MKYIKVPDSVKLTNLFGESFKDQDENDAELTCQQFILQRLSDAKFGQGLESVMSSSQIKKAVDSSDNSDVIQLETKDWELLVTAVKEPSPGNLYNTTIAHCLLDFMKAVVAATDDPPVVDLSDQN